MKTFTDVKLAQGTNQPHTAIIGIDKVEERGKQKNRVYIDTLDENDEYKRCITITEDRLTCKELCETSDKRCKENFIIPDFEDSFNKIMAVEIVDYNFIGQDKENRHRGLIAQQLKEHMPDVVDMSNDDAYSVNTRDVLCHLIHTVQYLSKKVEKLEAKN